MMGITSGFGTTIDLERGMSRQWVMGEDGVKRWVDNGEVIQPESKTKDPIVSESIHSSEEIWLRGEDTPRKFKTVKNKIGKLKIKNPALR